MKNFEIAYEEYKRQLYDLSDLEFEIMSCKLSLWVKLDANEQKLFERYEAKINQLLTKKENAALKFGISINNPKQKT